MPVTQDIAVLLVTSLEEAGLSSSDIELLAHNKIFGPHIIEVLKPLCEHFRGLQIAPSKKEVYPKQFDRFYLDLAESQLRDLKQENRGYAIRVLAAFIFLSKTDPVKILNASAAADVLGVTRQAVARGLNRTGLTVEDLAKYLP